MSRNHGIVAALIIGIAAIGYLARTSLPTQEINPKHKIGTRYQIAILQPVTHPALDEIRQGFIESFNQHATADYKIFNANGDRTLLTAQANEIVHGHFDAVLSIATQPTLILKELCARSGCNTPIVGAAVNEPVENKLIDSLAHAGSNIVVATETDDLSTQLQLLQQVAPTIQKLLLVYNPNPLSTERCQQIATYCTQHRLQLAQVAITNTAEIYNKVAPLLPGNDCVLVLKDNVVVGGIDSLITLCNKHHIMLYVSDLNSGQKGASLAYGVQECEFGIQAALLATKILIQQEDIQTLASAVVNQYTLQFNTSAIVAQQAPITPSLLQLLSMSKVIA